MRDRKVTKAYILNDGEVIPKSYLDQYAIKQDRGSKQLPSDRFSKEYDTHELVAPLYNLEALARLLEINTYHYRCVKTKARDVAGLGWKLEPREDVQEPSKEERQRAMEFLKNPNPHITLTELLDRVMVDHEATGNGYLEIIRSSVDEYIQQIEHIPAHTVRRHADGIRYVQMRGAKKVWFKAFGEERDIDFQTGEFHPKGSLPEERRGHEILHIYNYTSRSDYYGLPDILPALGAILGDRERQEYNISFFDNHAVPAYAVTVVGADLDEETESQIRHFFQNEVKKNRHSTLVLTAKRDEHDPNRDQPIEFRFERLSAEVKEASFRIFRQDNRDEVLSAHGVPPYRAGISEVGNLGATTAQESTEIYKQSVIRPKQETLASRINRYILKEGLDVHDWKFHFEEIDTRDIDKQIERLERLFRMGAYSPNMILEVLGEDTVDHPAMDMHYINGRPICDFNIVSETEQRQVQEVLASVKSLRQQLVEIIKKEKGEDVS